MLVCEAPECTRTHVHERLQLLLQTLRDLDQRRSRQRGLVRSVLQPEPRRVHLKSSVEHLKTSEDHLKTSVEHLKTSVEPESKRIHLKTSVDHLKTTVDHLRTSVDHLKTTEDHLKTGVEPEQVQDCVRSRLWEENVLQLKERLSSLRCRDAGLVSDLEDLDRQILELRLDYPRTQAPPPDPESPSPDSRPSSGFFELSDEASRSTSLFSLCSALESEATPTSAVTLPTAAEAPPTVSGLTQPSPHSLSGPSPSSGPAPLSPSSPLSHLDLFISSLLQRRSSAQTKPLRPVLIQTSLSHRATTCSTAPPTDCILSTKVSTAPPTDCILSTKVSTAPPTDCFLSSKASTVPPSACIVTSEASVVAPTHCILSSKASTVTPAACIVTSEASVVAPTNCGLSPKASTVPPAACVLTSTEHLPLSLTPSTRSNTQKDILAETSMDLDLKPSKPLKSPLHSTALSVRVRRKMADEPLGLSQETVEVAGEERRWEPEELSRRRKGRRFVRDCAEVKQEQQLKERGHQRKHLSSTEGMRKSEWEPSAGSLHKVSSGARTKGQEREDRSSDQRRSRGEEEKNRRSHCGKSRKRPGQSQRSRATVSHEQPIREHNSEEGGTEEDTGSEGKLRRRGEASRQQLVRIKASRNLKRRILRQSTGTFTLMTTV